MFHSQLPIKSSIKLLYKRYTPHKHYVPTSSKTLILHGFLGSHQNFGELARTLTSKLSLDTYGVDLRNHGLTATFDGHSQWCRNMDCTSLSNDLRRFINENLNQTVQNDSSRSESKVQRINIVGYSMGGKVAMKYALENPKNIGKLVIIDNSPTIKDISHLFQNVKPALLINALTFINDQYTVGKFKTWKPILANHLNESINNYSFALYLCGLYKTHQKRIVFKSPIEYLLSDQVLKELGDFPIDLSTVEPFPNEVLFIKAKRSNLIEDSDREVINRLFPLNRIIEFDSTHEKIIVEFGQTIATEIVQFLK